LLVSSVRWGRPTPLCQPRLVHDAFWNGNVDVLCFSTSKNNLSNSSPVFHNRLKSLGLQG
jgi:hypothetical protein